MQFPYSELKVTFFLLFFNRQGSNLQGLLRTQPHDDLTGMSSAKVALAEHVLFEHFGAAVGIVAGILLARGRLSYETILRLLPRSTFTQATTQAALLVLIQHNCLYFVSEEDEGTEYYEIDLEAVLQRRRYGQFMAIAREHWGKRAVEVLQRVMLDGKIQLSTLLQDTSHLSDQRQTIRAIYELLDAGALQPVNRVDQTSQADQDLQQEKRLLRDVKGPPGPKDIKMMRIAVEERRAEMAAQEPQWGRNHETFVATCLSDEAGGGIDEEYGHHGNDNKASSMIVFTQVACVLGIDDQCIFPCSL